MENICYDIKTPTYGANYQQHRVKTKYKNLTFKNLLGYDFHLDPLYIRTCFNINLETGSCIIDSFKTGNS